MSTRIHPKNPQKIHPKKRNSSGQKCPREFIKRVLENSPILSTKIRLLCPLKFCHVPKNVLSEILELKQVLASFMQAKVQTNTYKISPDLKFSSAVGQQKPLDKLRVPNQ